MKEMHGATLIEDERKRQLREEGYSLEHDEEENCHGELAIAADCYCVHSVRHTPGKWPWSKESWKPTPDNKVRQLVKAGALYQAEIDRLIRCRDRVAADIDAILVEKER